jgi:hypothetical protein
VLESRSLLSVVAVDVGQTIRPVNSQILGANVTWTDSALNTPQTLAMVKAAGLNLFRMPGGVFSDLFHFNATPVINYGLTAPQMAEFIASTGGTGIVTVNYGTGSPQEAAAYLAYLNAPVGSTTPIGPGPQWDPAANMWVTKDWKDAGYWAELRASSPLPVDDGLNFLRIGRVEPFGIRYFEVGNEVYGDWEFDTHAKPHDPTTYVTFAKEFATYAKQIDPNAQIGLCIAGPGSWYYLAVQDWTARLLPQCAAQGFIPDFLYDHQYMQDTFFESDQKLLLHTSTDPNSVSYTGPINWAGRARMFRGMINQYLGSAGAGIKLFATEYNTSTFLLTNQTTSLVSGLWLADSFGGMLQTEYDGATFWALRSGWDYSRYSPAFYGWRTGGDFGLIGSDSGPGPPQTGTYVPYPTYFAMQLVSKIVHTGDTVVQAVSDDPTLGAYAIKQADGDLGLLVINKNPNLDLDVQFQINGFTPNGEATVWQYGKAEDTAQSQTTDGHSNLTNFTQTVSMNGSSFDFTFPQYSMTVLDLSPLTSRPPGWTSADIGRPLRAVSSWSDGTTWTESGGRSHIGNTSDQFHFDSCPLDGDGSISARVDGTTNTNPSAKAGVMIRGGTAANARFVSIVRTPDNGLAFQWRTSTGRSSGIVRIPNIAGPVWVKLTRASHRFAGYYSLDGAHWTQVGGTRTIAMKSIARAGLAVSAHGATALTTATFTNVALQSGFTTALSRTGWVASASSTEFSGSPTGAIDNSLGTRWSSGVYQAAGQWFQLDLGSAQTFQRLVLDSTDSPFDYPRGFAVYLSDNGTDWTSQRAVASGTGSGTLTTITLPAAVTARYVRIVLTQSGPYWWSIHDLGVFV